MNEEIWKDIKGYEGLYIVSDLGKVRSLERECTQLNGLTGNYNTRTLPAKEVATFKDKDGYIKVKLNKSGVKNNHMVHRLVATAFIPNPENKPEVNHKFGIKSDNRASELEWMTTSENQQHAHDNKLYECQKGETNGMSKLSEGQVREIHKLYATGDFTQDYLSKRYNVAGSAISRILTGFRWKHIYKELYGD